jgi:hypothetical protein
MYRLCVITCGADTPVRAKPRRKAGFFMGYNPFMTHDTQELLQKALTLPDKEYLILKSLFL